MAIQILGIESSCDETSASICHNGKIINNVIATQSIHEEYGGVVPELASRAHLKNIIPVVNQSFLEAGLTISDMDAVAYTRGPGLLGALLVGSSFSKALAYAAGIPIIGVNHMHAHILSHFIDDPHPKFPFLCLTISGGHTQIVRVEDHMTMKVIGQTLDDAVGEAFDKGAKLLNLPYPGGPLIDKYASQGNPDQFNFPESEVVGLDFSFSGIKTSLLYFLREQLSEHESFIANNLPDICASYQSALVKMLFKKLENASIQEKISHVAIAGGVSANSEIRKQLEIRKDTLGWNVYIPKFEYCTDNAAMIAIDGYYQFKNDNLGKLSDTPLPRMPL